MFRLRPLSQSQSLGVFLGKLTPLSLSPPLKPWTDSYPHNHTFNFRFLQIHTSTYQRGRLPPASDPDLIPRARARRGGSGRMGPVSTSTPTSNATTRPRPHLTISVDGNISAGKSTVVSTLVDLFPKSFNYAVEAVPEPLSKWTNMGEGGHNLLDMLYKDTAKNNFMFQHYVQLTRLMDIVATDPSEAPKPGEENFAGKIRIMERSVQNNRYVFSELARRQGTLHEAEFCVLAEWFKWLDEHVELPLDLIIYLRTTPKVVYERMRSRGRTEESIVPLEYLSDLHETYEDWLTRNKIQEEGAPAPSIQIPVGETATATAPQNQDVLATATPTSNSNLNGIPAAIGTKYKVIVIDADKTKEEVAQQCQQYIQEFLNDRNSTQINMGAEVNYGCLGSLGLFFRGISSAVRSIFPKKYKEPKEMALSSGPRSLKLKGLKHRSNSNPNPPCVQNTLQLDSRL